MTLVFCKLRPSFSLSRQRSRVRAPSSPPLIPKDLRDDFGEAKSVELGCILRRFSPFLHPKLMTCSSTWNKRHQWCCFAAAARPGTKSRRSSQNSNSLLPANQCIDNLDRLSLAIFFIAYLFHPGDGIAIEFFCDGGMRHRGGWRGSVPVLCSGWNPDDIPFSYLLNRASPLLNPTNPGCNDQSLAEGCVCHTVRAPGSNVTLAPTVRDGSMGSKSGSICTEPVKCAAAP